MRLSIIIALLALVLVSGCFGEKEKKEEDTKKYTPAPAVINTPKTTLLDEVLKTAGLDRDSFGFKNADIIQSNYFPYIQDEFRFSWFEQIQTKPLKAASFQEKTIKTIDDLVKGPHPVADLIRFASDLLDRPFDDKTLTAAHAEDFEKAIKALRESVPPELARAITPLILAIGNGVEAAKQFESQNWRDFGGNLLLVSAGQKPDILNQETRNFMLGKERAKIYQAASQIAFAIENINWSPFAGMKGVQFDFWTSAGWIIIRDGSDHVYDTAEDVLLIIDLGGNDIYLNNIASNNSGKNTVSIAIDLAGKDIYAYKEYKTPYDREGLLPADIGGRYRGNENYGPISLSDNFRQGAARNGIAMLFDFGSGDDFYQSLRGSQGYAHFGVGVLYDEGGNDKYFSEIASQGSAQFGIGILLDKGNGNDFYRSFSYSQGFGYVAGVGWLIDDGGDDNYIAGGILLYPSAQLPKSGNESFSQGAGLGRRGTDGQPKTFLSGGLGILRDIKGNDKYTAEVFSQGAGYWRGIGILADGNGNDVYNALYYSQGSAVHFGIGILVDNGEGNDIFNRDVKSAAMTMGAARDFGLGFFLNNGGNDVYYLTDFSAGAANANGIGIFIDKKGDDKYIAFSDLAAGIADTVIAGREDNFGTRAAMGIAFMLDGSGKDEYLFPGKIFPAPENNKTWKRNRNNLPEEHGAGLDGESEKDPF